MRRSILISILFFTACTEELEPLGGADASVPVDLGVPDSGVAEPDAGFAPDAESGRRRLVSRRLFGEMPLENRVHDPVFDLDSFGWYAMPKSSIADRYPELWAKELPATPTGQPVLGAPKAPTNAFGVGLIGSAKSHSAAIDASVYIGRRSGVALPVDVSLLGVNSRGEDVAYDLLASGDAIELDGITWRLYSARVGEPTIGWMEFWITDDTNEIFYVTAPLIVPAPLERRFGPSIDRVARRQNAAERDALHYFAQQQKHRLAKR